MYRIFIIAGLLLSHTVAQITYTGCHNVSISTALVEYCYGPNGIESPLLTFTTALAVPPTIASATLPASVSATTTRASGQTTAITACHKHGSQTYCINGAGQEVLISATASSTGEPPAQYTGCHAHGSEQYCMDPQGGEVLVLAEGTNTTSTGNHTETQEGQEMDCHFHAGVEHCVPIGTTETTSTRSCERRDRAYNIPIRVGTLFAVLVTSGLGVFLPMFIERLSSGKLDFNGYTFVLLKQFGTGVIIATAFVHLYTHASLMFNNECLGRLAYEATTSAIVMAGILLSFIIEYASHRFIASRAARDPSLSHASGDDHDHTDAKHPVLATTIGHHGHHDAMASGNTKLSVMILEAGILFHSLILGLTLVVAGDSGYITLFIVIVFHQFFEGLALGTRIASLPSATTRLFPTKVLMGAAFALVTPTGMGIGIGVLNVFNGNNPSTIIAIGTLDAVSAGILIWVGLVEMLAGDWFIAGGDMVDASIAKAAIGGFGLLAGAILMSVLGKWA